MFKVGDRVICVKKIIILDVGKIYTIMSIAYHLCGEEPSYEIKEVPAHHFSEHIFKLDETHYRKRKIKLICSKLVM